MATQNWKFTDDYATTYPGLSQSLLDLLVFSDHTISGNSFTGTLDFTATGNALNLLSQMTGITSVEMSGTIDATTQGFSVTLSSSNMTGTQLGNIPLIGDYINSVTIALNNLTQVQAEYSQTDDFALNVSFADSSKKISGTLITQIPMSNGLFNLYATFNNLDVQLSDLDFLLPKGNSFSTFFPSNNPFISKFSGTGLNLLSIRLSLYVNTIGNDVSFAVSTLSVTVGIVNIPIYNNALFLNPLAVSVSFGNFTSSLSSVWAINGTLALYPYAKQANPPTVPPDFTFDVGMTLPVSGNPFGISGYFENPNNQSVAVILQDLFGSTTNVGIANDITITQFDFSANADSDSGAVGSFSTDIRMSGAFGILTSDFGLEEFNISVNYNNS